MQKVQDVVLSVYPNAIRFSEESYSFPNTTAKGGFSRVPMSIDDTNDVLSVYITDINGKRLVYRKANGVYRKV